jgi:dihydroorotate dehydrogenase (NAD+) catalytic subunit
VIAAGGIMDAADARTFLAAGARAVQVGSALFHDPTAAHQIVAALREETTA